MANRLTRKRSGTRIKRGGRPGDQIAPANHKVNARGKKK